MRDAEVDAQVAVRNAGWLALQRGIHIIGALLFAVLVPRLMGPETYGRYALITSIAFWFAIFSGLSAAQTMGRFVPQLKLQEGTASVQKLLGNLLAVRMTNGLFAAAAYLLLTALWFQELDLVVLGLIAASVFVRSGHKLVFALFLGLNRAARWGMSEIIHRWGSLAFVIPGFYLGGLRGACLALLLTELIVFAIGIKWAGPYFSWSQLRFDRDYVAPYLKFGAMFFASNLVLAASQRTGEIMIRLLAGDYVQVGHFGVAYRIYLTVSQAVWQLAMSFAPLLMIMLVEGRIEELKQWIERLLKWMAFGGVIAVYGALLLAEDFVPRVLGEDYRPVAANLLPLTIALLTLAITSMGRVLALSYNRPGVAFGAATIQLTVFWAVGAPLVASLGSLAGCIAALAASALNAAYYTWLMRRSLDYSLKGWAKAIALGLLFAPLVWMRASWAVNLALYAAFMLGYVGLLLALKMITPGELTAMWRAFKPARLGAGPEAA
ncbi:MAG: oligosaccharide flippase family protein [Blastocatellia bacterium]|nr:oligosaccharide flippase family protein [Blastocatellia bacterium]